MSRRLLQAMAGARHGGAETFFVRLASALQRVGETQRVLIRRDPNRARHLRAAGVTVGELGFGGPLDVVTRFGFRREVAAWRPDVVLTWMSRATQACPRGNFVHVARLGGYYDLKYYRRCDHLVANTRAIVDYAVAQGWACDRIDYLPNFVPDAGAPCRRAGASRQAPLALALGRLHPNKGFGLLLEALAKTREVRLAIAGDGPLRSQLERLARHLAVASRVQFLGWRDDVPALLAQADFLVCPSLHEPLGNVVIEAWSAGLPVVATASDGPAGLIEDEVNGLMVPLPGCPGGGAAALAAAIERLAGDSQLRGRLGRAGRRAYEAQFTEAAVVADYRAFFDRLTRAPAGLPHG
ncbi:MAG TPA: glycosyltransferase [Stellaceae bacterium]|jgi:glycosyltransferase involved in cell wall biosynthesis|nr:glycosyltransferase [Stellaceae bacterium]